MPPEAAQVAFEGMSAIDLIEGQVENSGGDTIMVLWSVVGDGLKKTKQYKQSTQIFVGQ